MKTSNTHLTQFLLLVLALAFVTLGFWRNYNGQKEELDRISRAYISGLAINVTEATNASTLADFLVRSNYIKDSLEARFLANHILSTIRKEKRDLKSINILQGKRFSIVLDSAGMAKASVYPHLMERISSQEEDLGISAEVDSAYVSAGEESPLFEGKGQKYSVILRQDKENNVTGIDIPVILRISEHWNVLKSYDDGTSRCETRDSVYTYVKMMGDRIDINLPKYSPDGSRRFFSVLPIKKGYNYGIEKGTYKNWRHHFSFIQRNLTLTPFEPIVFRNIKEVGTITVRTPEQYRQFLFTTLVLFCSLWILAFVVLAVIDKRRMRNSNLYILALGACLSGLGLMNLFSISNPLAGQMYAWSQLLRGIVPGIILMIVLAVIDWEKQYIKGWTKSLSDTSRQGWFIALTAIGLAIIMAICGSGPEGSGAKVNLSFGLFSVQGAPVIRFLLMFYFSIFLANKEMLIQSFSNKMDFFGRRRRIKLVSRMLIIVMTIITIQILLLSDLGPALCIMAGTVCIYSIVRKDFGQMLLGVGSFFILLFVVRFIPGTISPIVILLVWILTWAIVGYCYKKAFYESAVMMVLIISGFNFGGDLLNAVGMEDAGQRLSGRIEMCQSPFDNETKGGDQIANGIWAISNGGLYGTQGMLNCSDTIPAGHTDMVLCSLAESNGLMGVTIVLILLAILVYVSLSSGIKNGHVFSYYLSMLVGLGIGGQAMIIALGSVGSIALTGVNFPFLSFGSSALVVDMAMLGIIISISGQQRHTLFVMNTKQYVRPSSSLFISYCVLSMLVLIKVADYSVIHRKDYMVKPAIVRNIRGKRIAEYNPRIQNVQKRLSSGDILDRNGIIIATSDAETIMQEAVLRVFDEMGIGRDDILSQVQNQRRIYPCGTYLFFIVGDVNRKLLWGGAGKDASGILAEERYYSQLRGYDTRPSKQEVVSSRHHSRFLPDEPVSQHDILQVYDYSDLLPLMLSETAITNWNNSRAERDIQLTIDARLQVLMEQKICEYVDKIKRNRNVLTDRTRISFVLVDGSTGELLTSSLYPRVNPDLLAAKAKSREYIYRDDQQRGFLAYVDRDLGVSYATPPGSLSKTMTAGAGLRRYGPDLASNEHRQMVYWDEVVDVSLGEPTGLVDLLTAIRESSNVWFIKTAAGDNLYGDMGVIFWNVGVRIGNQTPYCLNPDEMMTTRKDYNDEINEIGRNAVSKYETYIDNGKRHRLIDAEYQESWGQGRLSGTPLALARYLGSIGHGGALMRPKYRLSDTTYVMEKLMSRESAATLARCMRAQAGNRFAAYTDQIGGKTGTPVRSDRMSPSGLKNDAWYGFIFIGANGHPYAGVVRLERVNANSRLAMEFTEKVFLPVLKECGYL